MAVDLTPLGNAIRQLRKALRRYEQDTTDEEVRDGLIQRFEFTYELSHKTLRRYLQATSESPADAERMTLGQLIRAGNDLGLVAGEWPLWKRFRDMRARSSHTYDEQMALEVIAIIPALLAEAEALLSALARHAG